MNKYSEHIMYLILFLFGLSVLLIITFALGMQKIWYPTLVVMIIVCGVITVLARFGDGISRTE